jgi:hypothetical protein
VDGSDLDEDAGDEDDAFDLYRAPVAERVGGPGGEGSAKAAAHGLTETYGTPSKAPMNVPQ